MSTELKICGGKKTALVDADDYIWAAQYNWFLKWNGYVFRWGKKDNGKPKMIYLHKEIIKSDSLDIDHKNRNKLDNTKENLRLATRSQNLANRQKLKGDFTSQYKGVRWQPSRNRWVATIISKPIGLRKTKMFKTEISAAIQYNEWAKEVFGEFAVLNEVSS